MRMFRWPFDHHVVLSSSAPKAHRSIHWRCTGERVDERPSVKAELSDCNLLAVHALQRCKGYLAVRERELLSEVPDHEHALSFGRSALSEGHLHEGGCDLESWRLVGQMKVDGCFQQPALDETSINAHRIPKRSEMKVPESMLEAHRLRIHRAQRCVVPSAEVLRYQAVESDLDGLVAAPG
jgi:hypothetical protein